MSDLIYEQVDDLKKIKKEYGEEMSHLCRDLFPTILEKKGLLYYLLSSHFTKSKELYNDIIREDKMEQFKNYIYFYYDEMVNTVDKEEGSKSVRELLKEVGYTLYECKTNEDILRFRKYYAEREALCTFRDPNRIDNHYIFFIVREDADKLDRSLFSSPKREDEYSLSVLDLQFDKGKKQRVSIKSRYNHTVTNPDATHSNNLENIVEGLTEAFEREYGFNIGDAYKTNFELDGYVQARDNKFYKYNYEIYNINYCPNNIIIDNGKVIDKYKDKSRYTFMDYFILDEKEKKIILYDVHFKDSFVDGLKNITNIEIINEEEGKKIILKLDGEKEAIIKLDRLGRIIGYENKYLEECGNDFLGWNKFLQEINLPNLNECENRFLCCNRLLQKLDLPSLKSCGSFFLNNNINLQEINLPNLEECGDNFLSNNNALQELTLPNLEKCGDCFLYYNQSLQELKLPSLQKCGNRFLDINKLLQKLDLPNLKRCGSFFLNNNINLQELNLPSLERCGDDFLLLNVVLQKVNLPNLHECGKKFLCENEFLQKLDLPSLKRCGNWFLYSNQLLQELTLPNLEECGDNFLSNNINLQELNLPKLKECGNDFLYWNQSLQELHLPNLERCGTLFLSRNLSLKKLILPKLQECQRFFLYRNELLQELNLSDLKECGDAFLCSNKSLRKLDLPNLERCGNHFLMHNEILQELDFPSLEEYGFNFIGGRFDEVIAKVKKR